MLSGLLGAAITLWQSDKPSTSKFEMVNMNHINLSALFGGELQGKYFGYCFGY